VAGTERQNLLAEYNEANRHLRSLITKLDAALTLSYAKLQEKEHEISRINDLHSQFEMRVSTAENIRETLLEENYQNFCLVSCDSLHVFGRECWRSCIV